MAVLATMIIIFLSVGLFIFVRYQCSVYDEAESPSKFVFVREPMNYDLNDLALSLPNGKIVNNKVLSLASDGGTVSRDAMVVLTSSEKQLKKFEEEEDGSFQETESQWCETNNSLGSFSEKNHFCVFFNFFFFSNPFKYIPKLYNCKFLLKNIGIWWCFHSVEILSLDLLNLGLRGLQILVSLREPPCMLIYS